MDTTALVSAINASTLVADMTSVMTALITLLLAVIGVVCVFVLVARGIRKIAGLVAGASRKI